MMSRICAAYCAAIRDLRSVKFPLFYSQKALPQHWTMQRHSTNWWSGYASLSGTATMYGSYPKCMSSYGEDVAGYSAQDALGCPTSTSNNSLEKYIWKRRRLCFCRVDWTPQPY